MYRLRTSLEENNLQSKIAVSAQLRVMVSSDSPVIIHSLAFQQEQQQKELESAVTRKDQELERLARFIYHCRAPSSYHVRVIF